jgi:putative acetyltransferase
MLIREERPADYDAVAELQRRAFGPGPHGDVVATLVGALRDYDPAALSLVADEDGVVVGHVLFTRCRLDAPPRLVDVQCLSPLGVAPERQRTGIGLALIRHGLDELDRRGVPLVFLEGDPAYYEKSGFEAAHRHNFRKPSLRIPDAGFQVVRLSAYEPWMTGTMVYSPVFWDLDLVGLRA